MIKKEVRMDNLNKAIKGCAKAMYWSAPELNTAMTDGRYSAEIDRLMRLNFEVMQGLKSIRLDMS